MIVKKPDAERFLGKKLKGKKTDWYVLSATGEKNLGGPYTKAQAKKRLGQVEFFKRQNPSVQDALGSPLSPDEIDRALDEGAIGVVREEGHTLYSAGLSPQRGKSTGTFYYALPGADKKLDFQNPFVSRNKVTASIELGVPQKTILKEANYKFDGWPQRGYSPEEFLDLFYRIDPHTIYDGLDWHVAKKAREAGHDIVIIERENTGQGVLATEVIDLARTNPVINKPVPIDKALYAKVKREAKKKFDVWPSIYASSWVVQEYKRRGGRYREENPLEGLDKWYAEKWVDLGRSIDSKGRVKKWVECGRHDAAEGKYPKCVPLAKAKKMTPKQRLSAVRRKRTMEKTSPKGKGHAPTMVKTFADNPKRKELYIKPNKAAVRDAKKGLEARKKAPKSKKGGLSAIQAAQEGIGSGVLRARDIVAGKKVNAYQVKAFFDRHRHNYINAKAKGLKPEESRAIQAWLLWGGEPLRKQVEKAVTTDKRKRAKNPARKFWDREHDWDEVLIQKHGKKITRKDILDYYKKNQRKIWPFLEGQTVMIILAPRKNETVLRRKGEDGAYIKLTKIKGIDDPHSYEYWIHRRVIEFHPVLTKKKTPIIWVDFDMHTTKGPQARRHLYNEMKKAAPRIKKIFKKLGVERSYVYSSGEDGGIHVEGQLERPKDVDKMRKNLIAMLKEEFADDKLFTTGLAKSGEIRLDTTTLHELGSLRAPWSFTKTGDVKRRIKA